MHGNQPILRRECTQYTPKEEPSSHTLKKIAAASIIAITSTGSGIAIAIGALGIVGAHVTSASPLLYAISGFLSFKGSVIFVGSGAAALSLLAGSIFVCFIVYKIGQYQNQYLDNQDIMYGVTLHHGDRPENLLHCGKVNIRLHDTATPKSFAEVGNAFYKLSKSQPENWQNKFFVYSTIKEEDTPIALGEGGFRHLGDKDAVPKDILPDEIVIFTFDKKGVVQYTLKASTHLVPDDGVYIKKPCLTSSFKTREDAAKAVLKLLEDGKELIASYADLEALGVEKTNSSFN